MARTNSKETTKKWIYSLNNIKNRINNNNYKFLYPAVSIENISKHWVTFLKDNNIVQKNEYGFVKWNEKIKITTKITDKFRDFVKLKEGRINLKNEQQPTLFDKPKTNKTRNVKIEFYDKPKEQIGLIRKFWRWIY